MVLVFDYNPEQTSKDMHQTKKRRRITVKED